MVVPNRTPQQRKPPPAQPAQAQQPQGWDFTGAGVGEQTFQNTQGQYGQPSQSEQFAASLTGAASPFAPTNAQGAYDQFQAQQPVNMDPFYDRARTQTLGAMNDQAAARGAYGSSQTMNNLQDAAVALGAQQAGAEANYQLQRGQTAGGLAAGADSQNINRLGFGAGVAAQADQQQFQRLQGLQNAAFGAQDARRARGRDMAGDVMQSSQFNMALQNDAANRAIQADQAAFDQIMALQLAAAQAGLSQSQYLDQLARGDIGALMESLGPLINPLG